MLSFFGLLSARLSVRARRNTYVVSARVCECSNVLWVRECCEGAKQVQAGTAHLAD